MEGKLTSGRLSYNIANRSRLAKPVFIHCNIDETLTPISCSKIVTEIAKYVLCNKLIPYPYYTLKNAAENFNTCSTEQPGHTQSRKAVRMKRHHKKMVEAYRNFESIFQNVQLELQNSVACGDAVEEVVLLIGATSRSPREVYRIVIPPVSCVELDQKQSENRIRLNLLRCVVLSEDLTDMLDRSIGLTNMYVMLKKRRGTSSHWFVPDDSYGLPLRGRQAVIFLGGQVGRRIDTDAICKEVAKPRTPDTSKTVEAETNLDRQRAPLLELIDGLHINPTGTQWFQSRVCLKGFRLVCL